MLRTFVSVALLSFQLNAAPLLLSGDLNKDLSLTNLAINKKFEGTNEYLSVAQYQLSYADGYHSKPFRDVFDRNLFIKKFEEYINPKVKKWDAAGLINDVTTKYDEVVVYGLDNLIPMPPLLNRQGGIWYQLKRYELEMAQILGRVSVVSGYHVNNGDSVYFKILVNEENATTISYLMSERDSNSNLSYYITSISCIESLIERDVFAKEHPVISTANNSAAQSPFIWTSGGKEPHKCRLSESE